MFLCTVNQQKVILHKNRHKVREYHHLSIVYRYTALYDLSHPPEKSYSAEGKGRGFEISHGHPLRVFLAALDFQLLDWIKPVKLGDIDYRQYYDVS